MTFALALLYCLGSECVSMHFPPATKQQCAAMRRLVTEQYRSEGHQVMAVCYREDENEPR